jgi:hypothetical protein
VSDTDPQVSITDTPTVTPTSDSGSELVHLDMLLTGAAGMLAGRAAIAWESITARYIEETALKEKNWRVTVTTNVDEQQIVTGSAGFGSRRERFLQEDPNIKSLLIKFDANVDFISVPRRVSAEDLIGEAFNSDSEREIYRDKLLAADPVFFTFVTGVQIRVEGAVPIEEPLAIVSQATSPPASNKSMVGEIVGIVMSVLLLLVAFVALFIVLRRRRHYSKDHYGGTDPTNISMQHDPNIAVVTVTALPVDTRLMKYRYVEEIHVSDIEDDAMSAMTSLPGLNGRGSVVEDRTVSVNLDYDLFVEQLKQQKTDSTDNESEASYDASRSRTTEAGTSLSPTLLGLDYLEEVTNEDDDDDFPSDAIWPSDNESKGASYDAPRGKTTVAGTRLYSPTLLGFDYLEYLGEVTNEDDNGDDYAALFPSDAMRWPSQYLPPNKLESKKEEVTNENDDDDDDDGLSALFPSDAMKWASH